MKIQQQENPAADTGKDETGMQQKPSCDDQFEVVRVNNPWDFAISPSKSASDRTNS